MTELNQEIFNELEQKMSHTREIMLTKFTNVRTGVANPKLLDRICIDYYGTPTCIRNLGTISVVEGHQIHIKSFDPTLIPAITRAILSSDLGLTPQDDGIVIRLILPQPTEERRKILIKEVEQIAEQTKVTMRNLRRYSNDKIKKLKLNKDLENLYLNRVQNINNKWIQLVEQDAKHKNKELLKI